jgi:peptidoglycan/xylan/chitin deacetylase (PgdA/CDA1 family)
MKSNEKEGAGGRGGFGDRKKRRRRGRRGIPLSALLWTIAVCLMATLLTLLFLLNGENKKLTLQAADMEAQTTALRQEVGRLQVELDAMMEWQENAGEMPETEAPESAGEAGAGSGDAPDGVWETAPPPKDSGYRAYQGLYPDLYAKRAKQWLIREKTVFLTFDDGPSPHTGQVLDTLKEKDVRGTFFIVGSVAGNAAPVLRRITEEGHTLAIHCNVHVYDKIYKSVEAFLDDFNTVYQIIYEATGIRPEIFRFPGGSVNNYNGAVRDALIEEMTRRGFVYYDWNATTGDSSSKVTPESAYQNAVAANGRNRVILLIHDTKKASADALPRIIDQYRTWGYAFSRLTNEDKPITL